MQPHDSWKRMLRKGGVTALLIGAVLALSGCWGKVSVAGGNRNLVVYRGISDTLIWNCTTEVGGGNARAYCVLDDIAALCRWRLPDGVGLTLDQCLGAADHGHVASMRYAIDEVLGPSADCLFAHVDPNHPFDPVYTQWFSQSEPNCD